MKVKIMMILHLLNTAFDIPIYVYVSFYMVVFSLIDQILSINTTHVFCTVSHTVAKTCSKFNYSSLLRMHIITRGMYVFKVSRNVFLTLMSSETSKFDIWGWCNITVRLNSVDMLGTSFVHITHAAPECLSWNFQGTVMLGKL